MKFGSLFSGIGGMDLGLERAGMTCAWQVEIDDYCIRVLNKHWPDVPKYKDVRDVGKHNLETVDLIAGGFPCTPHSVAGKRLGKEDDRNLWPEFIRIIRDLKPRYVLGENVPGIITTYLDKVLSDLEGEGYTCTTFNIPSCAFDAPHRRERIFIVAYTLRPISESGSGRRGIRKSDKDVADGDRARLAFGSGKDTKGARENGGTIAGRGEWWAVEPDVGRVVARFSAGMDGGLDAHEECLQKASAKGIPAVDRMRTLREYIESPEASSEPRRCSFCGHPLSSLPCEGACAPWRLGSWTKKDEDLRCMQEGLLGLLAHQGEDVQQILSIKDRAIEREQTMASRVDRLRGLGNAVVPQVAQYIGERIIEFAVP